MTQAQLEVIRAPYKKIDILCQQYDDLFNHGRYSEAENVILQMMEINPPGQAPSFHCGDVILFARCEEKRVGNIKAALPYWRKYLCDPQTGQYVNAGGTGDAFLYEAALLFERNGELADAKDLYNSAASHWIKDEDQWIAQCIRHHRSYHRRMFLLPLLTDQSSALDLCCYAHLGIVKETDDAHMSAHEARVHLEAAISIKDCDLSRYYLGQYQINRSEQWAQDISLNPPSPAFKAKFDEAKAFYKAKPNWPR